MIALIDGDIISHMSAFSMESRWWGIMGREGKFKYKKEAVKFCDEMHLSRELCHLDREANYDLSRLAFVVNYMVRDTLERTGADEYILFFSGKNVFRHNIGRDPVSGDSTYKANRDPKGKPIMLKECLDICWTHHPCFYHNDLEADDLLGIYSGANAVVCSIDKDLLQIPGLHYNIKKKTLTRVTSLAGFSFFCSQILTGDAVDGIIGLKGVGPVKAAKLMNAETGMKNMFDVTAYMYRHDTESMTRWTHNVHKLWILRNPIESAFKYLDNGVTDPLLAHLDIEKVTRDLGL